MSGHSKWATIKRKKAATDAARGKTFTKAIKEITIAARQGGGDAEANPRLRTAVAAAKAVNMPAANIERAIKKGTGELEGVEYVEVVYEAYGPGGVALMIQALTDNPTRTVAEIRTKLSRGGGNLGTSNSVAFLFDRKGQIHVPARGMDEDAAMERALEAGAEDFVKEDELFTVTTSPADLHAVKAALDKAGLVAERAELSWIPKSTVRVEGANADALLKLLEAIEDLDDVQKVDANFDMDVSEIARA
jgi:YebC/PmpR family DNA-binding regulatory protein